MANENSVVIDKEKCPWCGAEEVHPPISRFVVRGKDVLQFRECKKCKGYWQASYSFSGQVIIWAGCDVCGDPRPHYAPECPYDPPEGVSLTEKLKPEQRKASAQLDRILKPKTAGD